MFLLNNNSYKKLFSITKWLYSTFALALVAGILLGIAITDPSSKVPFFGLFAFPCILILLKPEIGIWIILIFVFYINYLADEIFILPGTVTWMIEVSLIAMIAGLVVEIVLGKKQLKRSPVDLLLLLFVISGLFSAFMNHNSIVSTILGYRSMLKMVLLYYCIIHVDFEEDFFKKIVMFLFVTALIQGPIGIIQHLIWTPELEQHMADKGVGGFDHFDFANGTTGIGGITAIYVMGFISILIAFVTANRAKFSDFLKFILLVIPIVIGSSRASFLYLPVLVMFMMRRSLFNDVKKGILVALAFVIVYVGIINLAVIVGYDAKSFLLSPAEQFESQAGFRDGQPGGRVATIIFANTLMKSPRDYLFGFGPNSASTSSLGGEFSGKLVQYLLGEDLIKNKTSFINSQVSYTLLEWGYVGFGLYMAMIVKIYLMNRRFYMAVDDQYWKTISFGFSGVIFLYMITTVYKAIWSTEETSLLFWVLAGVIFSMGKKKGIF